MCGIPFKFPKIKSIIRSSILTIVSMTLLGCLSLKSTTSHTDSHTYQYVLKGSGAYTIILESGLGDDLSTWNPIFNNLSSVTRTFAYNRSGYGRAEMNSNSKDALTVANDLYTLLKNENIHGPYILIGHSLGGQYMLGFAKLFPDEVVRIILLDARPPNFTALCKEQNAGNCEIPKVMYSLMPKRNKQEYDDSQTFNAHQLQDLAAIKSIPLTVITREKEKGLKATAFNDLWNDSQKEMVKFSENGSYYELTHSGHYVHKDQPKKVLEIIEQLIAQL